MLFFSRSPLFINVYLSELEGSDYVIQNAYDANLYNIDFTSFLFSFDALSFILILDTRCSFMFRSFSRRSFLSDPCMMNRLIQKVNGNKKKRNLNFLFVVQGT